MAEESKLDPREVFKKEKKRFGTAVKIAIAVSKAAAGREPEGNIVMASYVFTRMSVAAIHYCTYFNEISGIPKSEHWIIIQ